MENSTAQYNTIYYKYNTLFKFIVGLHGDKTYNILFVETPRKFITAKLSIRKPGSSSVLIICDLFSNKFTWCFHKQNIIIHYLFRKSSRFFEQCKA